MTGRNLYLLLYATIALLCVSISVYLSYYGYYSHLEELTFLFAALIGLLLFGADMLIRQFRLARRSLLMPLLFFALIAAFSGASNFNYLYTNFMQERMAQRQLAELFRDYRQNLTDTRSRLLSTPFMEEGLAEHQRLERELEQLRQQVTDPRRPGCGRRCRDHMAQIHQMLGGAPTQLATPSVEAPIDEQRAWYQDYRNVVMSDFRTGVASRAYRQAQAVVERIDELLARYKSPQKALERASAAQGGLLNPEVVQ
ncbi:MULTISPECIES: hypothetical protein [unclassified Halorhodospira]|uniref:hypothetical protein n=1 Tax=unclassified Halorhodospira TaxID=2626748 RepID=UPI001EE95ADB|nr:MULTISPECIES: hypothetical protein [unclassified Halorhodospira]MCG5541933.1 hypothetical protein [Halorhodospira sp. M39old]MCG5547004.1 hypothetical protein [Halorhodospira sp. M38]